MADSIWVLAMVIPAVSMTHRLVILREEAYLTRKFGERYLRYKRRVVLNQVVKSVISECRGIDPTHVFTYDGHPIQTMNNSAWLKGKEAGRAHPGSSARSSTYLWAQT